MIDSIKALFRELSGYTGYGQRTKYDLLCVKISEYIAMRHLPVLNLLGAMRRCGISILSDIEHDEEKVNELAKELFGHDFI